MGAGPALSIHSLALWTLYRMVIAKPPVTAKCGEDVTLSCTFPVLGLITSERVNVTWEKLRVHGQDLLVHSYSSGTEKQAEAYRGRTQLEPEGFARGDASLRLRDIHTEDEGSYCCYVNSELGPWSEETSLTVLRARQWELPVVVQQGEDVLLTCTFTPGPNLQLLNITWKKETAEGQDLLVHTYYNGRDQVLRQDKAYRGRTQLYPERFQEGYASLRLKNVCRADEGFYTCHVWPELGRFSVRMRLTVEEGARCVWFYLVLLFLLLLLILLIKKHRLPIRRRLRQFKHVFALEAIQPFSRLSEGSADDVERTAHLDANLLWGLRVDDTRQTLESRQTPAWNERVIGQKSGEPKFFPGNSPAREKVPTNVAGQGTPGGKGQLLSSHGVSTDSWINEFTAEANDHFKADFAQQGEGESPRNATHSVALLGQTGSGKSTFLNAIRGLGDEEEGAAETGVVETTIVPTSYQLPQQPNVTLWELPGFRLTKPLLDTDFDLFSISRYDVFLLFSSHYFTAAHVALAQKIQRVGKKVYFVRSKVDRELLAARKYRPSTYTEERILQRIRDTCVKSLQRGGVTSPQVFLLSSFEYGRHDFPLLEELLQDLGVVS
ncbi:uncharacterized protein LOC142003777 [Carettochelys insculpta]|uniref:uncharacterized protein LOC142003777 n=1 Tax=Carettochelys insculpta TaxID=44489 RepID=UPI003EBF0F3E